MECLFCKIAEKKVKTNIIAENEGAIAILDIHPASDGHSLIITKEHFANVSEVNEQGWSYLLPLIKKIINKLQVAFQPSGFNVITNMNEVASQSIFHLHIHVIPKYEKDKGFIWTARAELKYSLDQVAEKLKTKSG
jgi:histidine triad (HIT) family protein